MRIETSSTATTGGLRRSTLKRFVACSTSRAAGPATGRRVGRLGAGDGVGLWTAMLMSPPSAWEAHGAEEPRAWSKRGEARGFARGARRLLRASKKPGARSGPRLRGSSWRHCRPGLALGGRRSPAHGGTAVRSDGSSRCLGEIAHYAPRELLPVWQTCGSLREVAKTCQPPSRLGPDVSERSRIAGPPGRPRHRPPAG